MILPEPIPSRIAALPRDDRGYPVPWFVAYIKDGVPCARGDGVPDFRVIRPNGRETAFAQNRCWVCGALLGSHRVFAIGPMCVINRVTSEPPSHRDCAEWSAKACPFLSRPRMRRDAKNPLPEGSSIDGIHIDRNPGVICLYETARTKHGSTYKAFSAGHGGWLIKLGEPVRVDWWAEGRTATRTEVVASIESGVPILMDMARRDGSEAVAQLDMQRRMAERLLPA